MAAIICQYCAHKNPEEAQQCASCEKPLLINCRHCDTENPAIFRFCKACAQALPEVESNSEAERRHLTVMFCDLVGSTALSESLDPEELRDLVQSYQEVCAEEIDKVAGYIAQYLGDGILVYFGYPRAHEDETLRAVKTGLNIVESIKKYNKKVRADKGIEIAVRVGIHTGLVVIGDIGRGAKRERLALGETPNIAARVQGLAEPNEVAISAQTQHIVRKHFNFKDLGCHTLKGISTPMKIYQPVAEKKQGGGFQSFKAAKSTFIGREKELEWLLSVWTKVREGTKQLVLLSGEAGIGKSHLLKAFYKQIRSETHFEMLSKCSPYHIQTAYYPIIDLLVRMLDFRNVPSQKTQLEKLERLLEKYQFNLAEVVPLIASLLFIPTQDKYEALSLSSKLIKEKTLHILKDLITRMGEEGTVLFVLEDLQWADPSTLEFLNYLTGNASGRLCYIFTFRPPFAAPWEGAEVSAHVKLSHLSRAETIELANAFAGDRLPEDLVEELVMKTDGVPLFVEELVTMIINSNILRKSEGGYALTGPLPELSIPATLRDLLTEKLDRLGVAKEIAQLAAVFGREFSVDIMEAISGLPYEELSLRLTQLIESGLLALKGEPPYVIMYFKHALMQEEAYQLLLKSKRQIYHGQIASVIEAEFPDFTRVNPGFLAYHYTQAESWEKAIHYWQKAGALALEKSTQIEGIDFFRKGLSLLEYIPDAEKRDRMELLLQMGLAPALLTVKGYTHQEVEDAYERANELSVAIDDMPQLSNILRGLWSHYLVKARHKKALKVAHKLRKIAAKTDDVLIHFEALKVMGGSHFWMGDFQASATALKDFLDAFDPAVHYKHIYLYSEHPAVSSHVYAALTHWMLGHAQQSDVFMQEALDYARKLSHPFSMVYAGCFAALLYLLRREIGKAYNYAVKATELARQYGFSFWQIFSQIILSWTRLEQGEEDCVTRFAERVAGFRASGVALWVSHAWALLADYYGKRGEASKGLQLLDEIIPVVQQQEERFYEAELHRIKGELLWKTGADHIHIEAAFKEALERARAQGARYFELRTLMSQALYQYKGMGEQVNLTDLETLYQKLEEQATTIPPDLSEAKELLKMLAVKK